MLRRAENPLTPDRIRYALSKIHTVHLLDKNKKSKKIESNISKDANTIFSIIGISHKRSSECCA